MPVYWASNPDSGCTGLSKSALAPSLVKLTAFVGVGTDNKQVNKDIDV